MVNSLGPRRRSQPRRKGRNKWTTSNQRSSRRSSTPSPATGPSYRRRSTSSRSATLTPCLVSSLSTHTSSLLIAVWRRSMSCSGTTPPNASSSAPVDREPSHWTTCHTNTAVSVACSNGKETAC